MPSQPILSVVICTRNRASILGEAIESACNQDAVAGTYEVLVVDNGSTDGTRALVFAWTGREPSVEYVREPAVGLSRARNKGWREARGRYIAFIDDDCLLLPGWVGNVTRIISNNSYRIFGGPYSPRMLVSPPAWFDPAWGASRAEEDSRFLDETEYLDGGNIVIDRLLLEEVGGFNTRFGLVGRKMIVGEEIDLQNRLRKSAPTVSPFFSADLSLLHAVWPQEMRISWFVRRSWREGIAHALIHSDKFADVSGRRAARWFLAMGIKIVIGSLASLCSARKFGYRRRRFVHEVVPLIARAAAASAIVRARSFDPRSTLTQSVLY